MWHYIVRFFKFLYVFWHDVHLSKTWRKHSTLIECGFIMKERHPIISVREHQIRIHDRNYFKNHFSRLKNFYIKIYKKNHKKWEIRVNLCLTIGNCENNDADLQTQSMHEVSLVYILYIQVDFEFFMVPILIFRYF